MSATLLSRFTLPLLALAALTACDDDSTGPENRQVPIQVRVESNGLSLATATEFSNLGTELPVAVGVRPDYEIVFLVEDEQASAPVPYTPASDEYLDVTVANTAIARWETDTPGSFIGGIRGVSQGTTTVVFRLVRGVPGAANGTVIFEAHPIPVNINP